MKMPKYRPTKTLVLVAMLAVLLAALATLQYRWLGQVSAGERERMKASLDAGTSRFSQDFNREITRAYMGFQIDASMKQDENAKALGRRFEQWRSKAPYPELVSELYLVNKSEEGTVRFTHFNRSVAKLEPAEWPNEFSGLRSSLERDILATPETQEVIREIVINPVEPKIPALVSPVLGGAHVVSSEKESVDGRRTKHLSRFAGGPPFAGYLIIKLNINVITNKLIPSLAGRYFSGSSGLDYNLAVVNLREANKPIYQTEGTTFNSQAGSGDSSASLMDIQPEQLDALWFGLPRRTEVVEEQRSGDSIKPQPDKVIIRTNGKAEEKASTQRSVTVRVFNREANGPSSVDGNVERGPWQLLVQHRAGSLEAAVTNARRRNLVISFGILLLLAASVAMIVVSTRRSERLANRQMEFVSSVSHEFRTPLSVICSAGENLADGVVESEHQTRKYGELIRNEGRRLTDMVEQVLEYAGARSRHRSYQLRPVDIELVIDDALASYKPVIDEKGYVIEQDIDDGLPLVSADSAAIRSSLQNLLSNAMKYESEKRWIGIRARSANTDSGDEVQVIIEDKGIGISPDDIRHVFEPFFRGRDVVDAQIHGNGLGLSLVKQVLDAHHGRVSVVSVPGKGSAFTLHLPVMNQPAVTNENSADRV